MLCLAITIRFVSGYDQLVVMLDIEPIIIFMIIMTSMNSIMVGIKELISNVDILLLLDQIFPGIYPFA
jgi:hypothetical protein